VGTTTDARNRGRSQGRAPVAVVMIALNEAHNMEAVLRNLEGWAQEVFLVDSYSSDGTVDIALNHGVHVVQRVFKGFGDQWNFALRELPIAAPWTMKLDPDERLTDALKEEIVVATTAAGAEGWICPIRLFFMGKALPVRLHLTRLWRTGTARFSEVEANEHARVEGRVRQLRSDIEHRDSPDLHHWLDKQNKYTTAEAVSAYQGQKLADDPRLFGTRLQRRMWIKKHFMKLPFRYKVMFLYHYVVLGAWRAGWVGYAWSRLRCDVYRLWEYKLREMRITGRLPLKRPAGPGHPDPRVQQY
jgi:glycosyltransferase involved in cell wall biosynthesis